MAADKIGDRARSQIHDADGYHHRSNNHGNIFSHANGSDDGIDREDNVDNDHLKNHHHKGGFDRGDRGDRHDLLIVLDDTMNFMNSLGYQEQAAGEKKISRQEKAVSPKATTVRSGP